jgi:FkbM family methyltransferase
MKLAGREFKLKDLKTKVLDLGMMLGKSGVFLNPIDVWSAYYYKRKPTGNKVHLKNGRKIYLSQNNHDIITVMIIFCGREYGEVPKNGIVMDVGANIGVYSLYAAIHGAKKVYAFEPNRESFDTLCKNIKENGFEKVIIPFNNAVSDTDGDVLLIPKASSPYNRISTEVPDYSEDMDRVETLSIPTVIKKHNIEKIDLLKMDCEGSEFGIIPHMPATIWTKIDKYKLEIHDLDRTNEITTVLTKHGFRNTLFKNMILWFEK